MVILYIISGICFLGCIFCIFMMVGSIKRKKKQQELEKMADYVINTEGKGYKFKYIIKGFDEEAGKTIKFVVNPVLGFSDLATSETNMCMSMNLRIVDENGISLYNESFVYAKGLNLTASFTIPKTIEAPYHIKGTTNWNLGGDIFDNEIDFVYENK